MKLTALFLIGSLALAGCASSGSTSSPVALDATSVSQAIAGAETALRGAEQGVTAAALNGWIKKDSSTAQTIVTAMNAANKAMDLAETYYKSGNLAAAQAQSQVALDQANQVKAQTPTAPTN